MAKTIWLKPEEIKAFAEGSEAAVQGRPRIASQSYETYNEKAAFNDGWDTVNKKNKKRSFKSEQSPGTSW